MNPEIPRYQTHPDWIIHARALGARDPALAMLIGKAPQGKWVEAFAHVIATNPGLYSHARNILLRTLRDSPQQYKHPEKVLRDAMEMVSNSLILTPKQRLAARLAQAPNSTIPTI